MHKFLVSLRVFITFTILLGIGYPLLITGISQLTMAKKANGSLIVVNGKVLGSELIGQEFTQAKYFHGRFSAVNYDARNSGGSNLGPSNPKLLEQVKHRIEKVKAENNLNEKTELPADMVLTSASGLDPHISVENAMLQIGRVAKARNLSEDTIKKLIAKNTTPDFIGIWGKPGVNVLKLNLALDNLKTINK